MYTTLVGLLNARNYNAGGEFVEMLVRNLKEALKTGELENARLMVSWDCHQSTKLLCKSLMNQGCKFSDIV